MDIQEKEPLFSAKKYKAAKRPDELIKSDYRPGSRNMFSTCGYSEAQTFNSYALSR
jgi:hypothetical protein